MKMSTLEYHNETLFEVLFIRDAEFAEIGEFFNQNLFTQRPRRLSGAISESCFIGKSEDPKV